jgi:hypothetical protein
MQLPAARGATNRTACRLGSRGGRAERIGPNSYLARRRLTRLLGRPGGSSSRSPRLETCARGGDRPPRRWAGTDSEGHPPARKGCLERRRGDQPSARSKRSIPTPPTVACAGSSAKQLHRGRSRWAATTAAIHDRSAGLSAISLVKRWCVVARQRAEMNVRPADPRRSRPQRRLRRRSDSERRYAHASMQRRRPTAPEPAPALAARRWRR